MKTLLSFLLCLTLLSCKTSSGSYEEKRDITTFSELEVKRKDLFTQSITDSILKKLSFSIRATITKFAPRDSTGYQEIESITEIDLTGEEVTEQQTTTDLTAESEEDSRQIDETTDNTVIVEKTKTDSRIFRPPSWCWWILLTIIILVVLVWKLKKRTSF